MKQWKLFLFVVGLILVQSLSIFAHHGSMKDHIVEYAPFWIPVGVILVIIGVRLFSQRATRTLPKG